MRDLIFLETPLMLNQLSGRSTDADEVLFIIPHDAPFSGDLLNGEKVCREDLLEKDTYKRLLITFEDRVIVQARHRETLDRILHNVLDVCTEVPIVVIISDLKEMPSWRQINISYLSLQELLLTTIDKEWHHIRNRQLTQRMRELTRGAENILILTQHDPDPDALASGLALRTLLGRNRASAPIGSFGKTTRSENLSMIRLLDIHYQVVDPQLLDSYAMIAMVDVQPPYFGRAVPRVDLVFDHHPQPAPYECLFKDIRVSYGATSTILSEYFISNQVKMNQRLATALFYGIKSDTFMLEREADPADVEAFTYLYPLANQNVIRQMERPSLDSEEVSYFVKALRYQRLINGVVFVHLGRVRREDIIPRLADFCLQLAGAEWSVVSGVYQRNLVISVRNVGYVKHAGEVIKKVFCNSSLAGGHRTMAKAVVGLDEFKKNFNIERNQEIGEVIITIFGKVLREKQV